MNELETLLAKTDQQAIVQGLKKKRYSELPDTDTYKEQINPASHKVFSETDRPNKLVVIDTDDPRYDKAAGGEQTRTEKVARLALAIQKLIVKRAVSFLFGNAVSLNSTTEGEQQEIVLKAVKRVMYDIKDKSFNRRVARHLLSCTEVAEVWYPVPKKNTTYGIDSEFKLRCGIFSPLLGDKLYPFFDKTGDMLAFSREYTIKEGEVSTRYFETYTDTTKYMWKEEGAAWKLTDTEPIEIGKIPVVYGKQDQVEWADVQGLIERLEKLISNFADTNDYHASPKIVVKGSVKGFAKKGEAGGILEIDENGSAEYLAWQNAPESVKLEIDTLLKMIYTITQTPDISFDSVKGIGTISGVALELLFMDAHLKVQDHSEVFDEYLQRRTNIVKAFIGNFNKKLVSAADDLMIEPQITPYIIKDKAAEQKIWIDANGGNPIMSQKASFQKAGLTSDTDADFEQYQAEQSAKTAFTFNEPTEV